MKQSISINCQNLYAVYITIIYILYYDEQNNNIFSIKRKKKKRSNKHFPYSYVISSPSIDITSRRTNPSTQNLFKRVENDWRVESSLSQRNKKR